MRDTFANADAGMAGLIICLTIFLAVMVWVFRPKSKDKFKKYGEIPFNEKE